MNPVLNVFQRAGAIIKKDFKLLLRSKSSALILILGPLVLILLAAFAFNSASIYDIKISTYSVAYSDLSNSFVNALKDEQYSVQQSGNDTECIETVKAGLSHVCLVFSPNMELKNDLNNEVKAYADYSRINLVYMVMDTILGRLSNKSEELSLTMTKDVMDKLQLTKVELTGRSSSLNALSSNTRDSKAKLEESYTSLTKVNSGMKVFNTSDAKEQVLDLQSENNLSESDISEITEMLDDIQTSITGMATKVEDSATKLNDVKGVLESSEGEIENVKTSVNKVVSSVDSISVTDPENIVAPIKTSIEPIGKKTHLGNTFPTLAILVIMFISILLASTMVVREKKGRAYFRNFITPTHDVIFLSSTFLTNLAIVFLQVVILLGVAAYFFKGDLVPVLFSTIITLLLTSSMFILLGMMIGYLFNSEETAILGAISVSTILLLFSNAILPIETIGGTIRSVVSFNPFVVADGLLKKVMLFKYGLFSSYLIYVILGFIVVFSILAFVSREVEKRRYM